MRGTHGGIAATMAVVTRVAITVATTAIVTTTRATIVAARASAYI